ncbi:MAG: carboxypeptidase M32, partial [Planctomycetota bacterium]
MDAAAACSALTKHYRDLARLKSSAHLLEWDQRVCMPAAGGDWRGEQLAALTGIIHEHGSDPRIGDWLAICEAAGWHAEDTPTAATLRRLRRDHRQTTAVPGDLAVALTRASSDAFGAWVTAREQDDFPAFRPHLERVLGLLRERAQHLGTHPDPYDTCFDEYEEGMTAAAFQELMEPVVPDLRDIVQRRAATAATGLGPGPFAAREQEALNWRLIQAMGFDPGRGRLDPTVHPFCTNLGPGDVRLTSIYAEHDALDSLSGTIHEMGHGLYEQGLPQEEFGLPLGSSVSLGIHESQSRLWENHVGRSAAFGAWALPHMQAAYGDRLERIGPEAFHRHQCRVTPGFIRVEADEACYDLHIWLRFRLERDLMRGDLAVADLPAAWNAGFQELFGLAVPDDRRGCLQDVHWSYAIGYFPTYTLGNCYAAQFMASIRRDLPDLDERHAAGDFAPLLDWLRSRIHVHGKRYTPAELCRRATGTDLDTRHLLEHIR